MKRLFLFLFFGVASLTLTHAAVSPPLDRRGNTLPVIDWVGALPCVINGANQPGSAGIGAPIVCGSSTTNTRSVVYGVIASSVTTTAYLVFRDTIPAGAGGVLGTQSSTVTVVYNYDTSMSSGAFVVGTHYIKFPVPLQFSNGIAVNTDSTFGGAVATWTILYRTLTANE